jgi:HK97 family phage major capsid protein
MDTAQAEALKAERTKAINSARSIEGLARAAGHDLNVAETQRANKLLDRVDEIDAALKGSTGVSAAARPATEGPGALGGSDLDTDTLDLAALERRTLRRDSGDSFEKRARDRAGMAHGEPLGYDLGDVLRSKLRGPVTEREQRAMAASSDVSGGFMLSDVVSAQIIDRLRTVNTAFAAGVGETDLSDWFTAYARITGDAVATSHAENVEIPQSNLTLGLVKLIPRAVVANVSPISWELLNAASNVSEMVSANLGKAFAQELDRQVYFGAGDQEMLGIANTPGVLKVPAGGANGGPLAGYDLFLDGRAALLSANAPEPTAAIMSVREEQTRSKWKDNEDRPLLIPPALDKLRFFPTTRIPINQKVGTSNNCGSIFLGGFGFASVGYAARLRIQVLHERFATQGAVGIVAYLFADLLVTQPAGFAIVTGVTP